ncbi:MAG: hypothetical protein ACERKZ_08750 [Lachnotalea sp.]
MKKRIYIISCILFLLLLATNIVNDKYSREFLLQNITFNNQTACANGLSSIVGTSQNSCAFALTPNMNLPKGDYIVSIQYVTNTNDNTITIGGKDADENVQLEDADSILQSTMDTDDISDLDKANEFMVTKLVPISIVADTTRVNVQVNFSGNGVLAVGKINVESAGISCTDTSVILVFLTIKFLLIGRMAFYKPNEKKQKQLIIFLILAGITMIVSFPMFNNYIMSGHDIGFHATRIEGIKNALLSGQFPVRIHTSTEDNYGYGAAMFYPELFLYIPAILRLLGVSVTTTLQMFIIAINFTTAFIMYFSVYKLSKVRSIGILGSILYVFANYRLCDLYTRFALGELIAIAFLPLVVYGVYELLCNDYTKWKYTVIGVSCVLQSHIITTVYSAMLILLVTVLCAKNLADKKRLFACIKAVVVTILLNSWFIVPLLMMMRQDVNMAALQTDIANDTIYINQLFWNMTASGGNKNIIGQNMQNVMPLSIGLSIIIGTMLFGYCVVVKKLENRKEQVGLIIMAIIGVFCALGATNLFPWKTVILIPVIGSVASMLQFPWRLLMFTMLFLSIPGAYGIYYVLEGKEMRRSLIILTFTISALISANYMENYCMKDVYCYKGEFISRTSVGSGEYYYTGTKVKKLRKRGNVVTASSNEVSIDEYIRSNKYLSVEINNNTNEEQYIELPLAYYPGYKARTNTDASLAVKKGKNNVVRVTIPSGLNGTIIIKYVERKLWRLFDIISTLTFILFILSFYDGIRDYCSHSSLTLAVKLRKKMIRQMISASHSEFACRNHKLL